MADDERESAAPSRFRPRYRALTQAEKDLHDAIKAKAEELELLFDHMLVMQQQPDKAAILRPVAPARYHALAITNLEESVMWAIKGLTA